MNHSLGNMLGGAGALNADKLALNLQFATDKTLTARKGPTPVFTRASTASFVGSNGLIQSAAINTARFDHDPITLACKGLLIEESRTNLITNSGNALLWPSTGTDEGSLTAPDGSSNGKLVGVGTAGITTSSVSATAIAYSFSVFVKRNNTDWFRLQLNHAINTNAANAWFNLATGSTGSVSVGIGSFASLSSAIVPLGDGWYRCIIIGTPPSSGSLTGNIISATGDSSVTRVTGSKYGIWGAQIEAGAFPTSYIPTTTASVVRSADICSISGASFTSIWNNSDGTLVSDTMIANLIGNNRGTISIDDGTATYHIRHNYAISDGGFISSVRANDTSTTANIFSGSASVVQKRATAYSGNNFAFGSNGGVISTVTRTYPSGLNIIRIGGVLSGSLYLNGHIARIQYFRKRLPNAKLQTLTA